ncbi:hypothetical protein C482_02341 [Natrialba chahannaoensis JCM 10990]|uniref:DUF8001 domain-containing protein n=1 Tax=Natrialba chahannaoensis JCM 10990 TaxID=1227492 RepID=M0B492_9EURY|nr:hypothetical protein [Natrialba chahannaoensis]ELZ05352.1 hypothetical protein C482_02341 [Natrialba chahannaoensis JCM 10990]
MTETIRVGRKDLTSTEIMRELKAGNRVIVEVDVLGVSLNMSIRLHAGTYYCDTPMKLLTYETDADMQACLERYRLARPGPSVSEEEPSAPV